MDKKRKDDTILMVGTIWIKDLTSNRIKKGKKRKTPMKFCNATSKIGE